VTGGDQGRAAVDVWVRRGCAVVVALVAAYASYEHQRVFAVRGGADLTSASLWPLSVDGLLLLASTALVRGSGRSRRLRSVVWAAFGLAIAVSLAANIASAPVLGVAADPGGWLAAGLPAARGRIGESSLGVPRPRLAWRERHRDQREKTRAARWPGRRRDVGHFQSERSQGRTPTGAELDRVAGTNNYGRAVVRIWHRGGRLTSVRPSGDGQLSAAAS
jgi:hypothetical protein